MSDSLRDLRDLAKPPQPTPAGPLARPADLVPVREPSNGLPKVNAKRQAEKKPKQHGEQAARCRKAPCACCGIKGMSQPHHWPTVAAGGLDRDTLPLCDGFGSKFCHDAFHAAGSPEAFLRSHGCNVLAAIEAMRRKPDHNCERFAVLRESGTPGRERSDYVCSRCWKVIPQEQEGPDA